MEDLDIQKYMKPYEEWINSSSIYDYEETLGVGAYGRAIKVKENSTGNTYVFKKFKNRYNEDRLRLIASIYETVLKIQDKCDGLVKMYNLSFYESGDDKYHVSMLMEYIDGENLEKFTKEENKLSINKLIRISKDIASTLKCISNFGIIHRDIKPDNILIDKKTSKLVIIDYDLLCIIHNKLNNNQSYMDCSKRAYDKVMHHPPHFDFLRRDDEFISKIDVWSLGYVMYKLLNFKDPFKKDDISNSYYLGSHSENKNLDKLVDSIFEDDYNDRPTIEEVYSKLNVLLYE
jgi:serine/threonine protein kinase